MNKIRINTTYIENLTLCIWTLGSAFMLIFIVSSWPEIERINLIIATSIILVALTYFIYYRVTRDSGELLLLPEGIIYKKLYPPEKTFMIPWTLMHSCWIDGLSHSVRGAPVCLAIKLKENASRPTVDGRVLTFRGEILLINTNRLWIFRKKFYQYISDGIYEKLFSKNV